MPLCVRVYRSQHFHPEDSMKKIVAVVLVVLMWGASVAHGEPIVVVTEEYAPYNFTDASGAISGLSTEVVREVFKRAGLDYRIDSVPWARAYRKAQNEPNIAIYTIARSAERESLFKWVGVIADWEVYLYKLKSRTQLKATKLDDLRTFVLGGVRDDVRAAYLLGQGFAVDLVTDDVSNIKKLQLGRIDAFPTDEVALLELAKTTAIDFASMERLLKLESVSSDLSLAFSLNTPDDTVNRCRAALERMKADGTFKKIQTKWRRR